MGLPPWETSESQLFALITGANSGLGYAIACRLVDEFFTTPTTPPSKHLILIIHTRAPINTRFTISRLRSHTRALVDHSSWASSQRKKAKAQGKVYKWEDMVRRVHFIGVEADLCDLKGVYALADRLVNGTVGSPDATTYDGLRLPHGSPGTQTFTEEVTQDRWALSQKEGSTGFQRSWGWGLSGIRIPRLDVLILNAGMGGWHTIDWALATWTILTDTVHAMTWPQFKVGSVGALAKPQLSSSSSASKSREEASEPLLSNQEKPDEPPLGQVFCSNTFGHYILSHELMPLLSRKASPSASASGRIIWISSIEAVPAVFDVEDIQGLKSKTAYESTKRLTDLLVLTSSLPSVSRLSAPFFSTADIRVTSPPAPATETTKPKMYVLQPGIFASEIIKLNSVLVFIYKLVFVFTRWIGGFWYVVDPYKAAVSPVWLSLSSDEQLAELDAEATKWGSATSPGGDERVAQTEVDWYGWGRELPVEIGEVRKGRNRHAVFATQETRAEFEVQGARCWEEMEGLRKEWEDILGVKK